MFTFIIVLSAILQSLVALFVLQRNQKSRTNLSFFTLSMFLVVWAFINFLITKDPFSSSQLLLYRLLMASVVAQNTFFFLFAHAYPNHKINVGPKWLKLYLVLSVVTLGVALSPILFVRVKYGIAGARPVGGPGMLLFVLHAAVSVFSGLRIIYKRYRRSFGIGRQQFQLIFFGSIILWGIVPFTNFFISMATQTLFFAKISPIYTLAFSSIVAYAIVVRKLFNIQAAVARSVAYVLALLFLAAAYAASAFIISSVLFKLHGIGIGTQFVYIALALLLASSFQPVKRSFDHITNRVFYQDAYDPQLLINRLNRIFVSSVEIDELLERTASLIEDIVRAQFCVVVLASADAAKPRVVGAAKMNGLMEDLAAKHLSFMAMQSHHQVMVTDDLGSADAAVKRTLMKADVAIVVHLGHGRKAGGKILGHIILGSKLSGNPYSGQDIRIFETIANELVIAIQNALRFEEIQNFNKTLQAKVQQATTELQRTNDKLKQLDETKDDFISMASHQLRTPLTSVKGYLSMVLEGDAGKLNPNQQKLLEQSYLSSQRMVYLISDLLNLSRLNTGKFVIEPSPVDLSEAVQTEVDQLVETAKSRNLKLQYERPASFSRLMLDETKIHQVIMNFIDNAIYYTPSGGTVTIELRETPTAVEYMVHDTGIGVPRSVQHKLFAKFYRAQNAQHARPDGTGLGLFMAKKVVVAQGGSIIFESEEGKGSTFGFRFSKAGHAVSDDAQPALAASHA